MESAEYHLRVAKGAVSFTKKPIQILADLKTAAPRNRSDYFESHFTIQVSPNRIISEAVMIILNPKAIAAGSGVGKVTREERSSTIIPSLTPKPPGANNVRKPITTAAEFMAVSLIY